MNNLKRFFTLLDGWRGALGERIMAMEDLLGIDFILELCYKREANIAIITSGGKLRDFAVNQQINNITLNLGAGNRG